MNSYTISQLARDSGISIHIIRDYVLRGLLHPVAHTGSGYSLFDEQSLHRLQFLRTAFEAGIGLPELARFCRALDADVGIAACGDELRERLAARQRVLAHAEALLDALTNTEMDNGGLRHARH